MECKIEWIHENVKFFTECAWSLCIYEIGNNEIFNLHIICGWHVTFQKKSIQCWQMQETIQIWIQDERCGLIQEIISDARS